MSEHEHFQSPVSNLFLWLLLFIVDELSGSTGQGISFSFLSFFLFFLGHPEEWLNPSLQSHQPTARKNQRKIQNFHVLVLPLKFNYKQISPSPGTWCSIHPSGPKYNAFPYSRTIVKPNPMHYLYKKKNYKLWSSKSIDRMIENLPKERAPPPPPPPFLLHHYYY